MKKSWSETQVEQITQSFKGSIERLLRIGKVADEIYPTIKNYAGVHVSVGESYGTERQVEFLYWMGKEDSFNGEESPTHKLLEELNNNYEIVKQEDRLQETERVFFFEGNGMKFTLRVDFSASNFCTIENDGFEKKMVELQTPINPRVVCK